MVKGTLSNSQFESFTFSLEAKIPCEFAVISDPTP